MTKRLTLSIVLVTAWLILPAAVAAQTAGGGSGRGTAPPTFQTPRAPQPMMPVDPRQWPQAFSVVLVIGEMTGTQQSDDVPAAARKALTDLKDFLPYKSYRLLDTHWTLCCGKSPLFSRLQGLDSQEYELHLTATVTQTPSAAGPPVPTVNVQFVLSEARHTGLTAASVEQQAQAVKLREELRSEQELAARGLAPQRVVQAAEAELRAVEAQVAAGTRRSANRTVVNTSFRMEVGETVVVGTSRIQGDKALIALLTAVPPKK